MKQYLFNKLIKYLKFKYWGLAFESDLPPEFIISKHAEKRMSTRIDTVLKSRQTFAEIVMNAWYNGIPEQDFKINDSINRKIFRRVSAKRYSDYIFLFGRRPNRKLGFDQKHLITVYNLKDEYLRNRS